MRRYMFTRQHKYSDWLPLAAVFGGGVLLGMGLEHLRRAREGRRAIQPLPVVAAPAPGQSDDELLQVKVEDAVWPHTEWHTSGIEISALHGRVTLRGPALAVEIPAILKTVEAIDGVVTVDNQLEGHEHLDALNRSLRQDQLGSFAGY